ncbi:MAG: hypothetical protein P0S96_03800 [Simkaniaceae bacterium]|nr:hypothetical protein [Candidatus Sacchlamyda saccharinae]
MNLKSERLKKLENELADLQHWLKLGLVPKKDVKKHEEEIEVVQKKVDEEIERLRFLKENGEVEEYTPPKRSARPTYQEPQSMPEMSVNQETEGGGGLDTETESFDAETSPSEETTTTTTTSTTTDTAEEEPSSQIYDEDDDPFSDKNRWKRGILEDPDADEW